MYYGQVEGTGFEVRDKRFKSLYAGHARIERLWSGARWCEGPVWMAAARTLVWSDIPNNRMLRLTEPGHEVSIFREMSNNSNGNTVDNQGRLVTCEHLTRRVTVTHHDGRVLVVADRYNGKRLNSPNDVVVKRDGSIWFTDPSYGIDADYEGNRAEREIEGCYVYRVDPRTRAVTAVVTDMVRPNGLAFSPDEAYLYIADTGITHQENGPKHIRRFKVSSDGATLSGGELFADCDNGLFDGFRVDTEGRIWSSAGDGVHVFDAEGVLLGKLLTPEGVGNVCFGGTKRNRLYIAGTTSIYSFFTFATGAARG